MMVQSATPMVTTQVKVCVEFARLEGVHGIARQQILTYHKPSSPVRSHSERQNDPTVEAVHKSVHARCVLATRVERTSQIGFQWPS